MLGIKHKTLNILRVRHAARPKVVNILQVDWYINCPRLILLDKSFGVVQFGICKSSGLASLKPVETTRFLWILHFDTLTERIATLDISSLPDCPNCTCLMLAAKHIINLGKLVKVRIKFPKIERITIFTSSIQNKQLISQLRKKIGTGSLGL